MKKIIVKIFWDNNYGAVSDEVLGCVATADTLEDVKREYASALQFHLNGMIEDGDELPFKIQGEYELEFDVDGQALIHSVEGLVTKAALSRATGINEKQLSHYSTGFRRPRKEQREKIIQGVHKIANELMNIK